MPPCCWAPELTWKMKWCTWWIQSFDTQWGPSLAFSVNIHFPQGKSLPDVQIFHGNRSTERIPFLWWHAMQTSKLPRNTFGLRSICGSLGCDLRHGESVGKFGGENIRRTTKMKDGARICWFQATRLRGVCTIDWHFWWWWWWWWWWFTAQILARMIWAPASSMRRPPKSWRPSWKTCWRRLRNKHLCGAKVVFRDPNLSIPIPGLKDFKMGLGLAGWQWRHSRSEGWLHVSGIGQKSSQLEVNWRCSKLDLPLKSCHFLLGFRKRWKQVRYIHHMYVHICMYTCLHAYDCIRTCIWACVGTYVQYIHTYTDTCYIICIYHVFRTSLEECCNAGFREDGACPHWGEQRGSFTWKTFPRPLWPESLQQVSCGWHVGILMHFVILLQGLDLANNHGRFFLPERSFPKLMSQHMTTCPFQKNFMHDSGSQMCCVETARVCNLPFLLIFTTTQSQHSGKWWYHNVPGMYMAAWTAWIYDAFENLGTSKKNSFRRNLQLYVTLSSLQIMSFSPIGPEVCKESGSAVCPLCCGLLPEPKLWCFDRWADFLSIGWCGARFFLRMPVAVQNFWIPKTSLQNTTSFQAFWCKFSARCDHATIARCFEDKGLGPGQGQDLEVVINNQGTSCG